MTISTYVGEVLNIPTEPEENEGPATLNVRLLGVSGDMMYQIQVDPDRAAELAPGDRVQVAHWMNDGTPVFVLADPKSVDAQPLGMEKVLSESEQLKTAKIDAIYHYLRELGHDRVSARSMASTVFINALG